MFIIVKHYDPIKALFEDITADTERVTILYPAGRPCAQTSVGLC